VVCLCLVICCYAGGFSDAILQRNVNVARDELAAGRAKVDACLDGTRLTALHLASALNDAEMVAMLLSFDANPDVRVFNYNALHIATQMDALEALRALLLDPRGKALINALSGPGETCLK